MKCDRCNAELKVGDWPFCPHEHVDHCQLGEEPLEPYWDHNLAPDPVYITTRGERRKLMSKNHLEYLDVSSKKRGGKLYFFVGGK